MSDIAPLTSLAGEHRIADTTIGIPHPYTAGFARAWITSHLQDWHARRELHWAAMEHGEKLLTGYAGLVGIDEARRQAELRFWVGRGVKRRRDALEWSEKVVDFAVNELGLRRIYSLQLNRHHLAARILMNIGMKPEVTALKRVFEDGPMEDVVCWATVREKSPAT
jgi:ribosomal-protein-alanine N-acetyltransferase